MTHSTAHHVDLAETDLLRVAQAHDDFERELSAALADPLLSPEERGQLVQLRDAASSANRVLREAYARTLDVFAKAAVLTAEQTAPF